MGFNCGIIGMPNVGKSTLFNALTKTSQAEAANYPFCTIEPNTGRVPVPDNRLEKLAKIANSAKTIYSQLEFVDIAGLVKDASKGEGLGNQFLGHIREVDAIAHVVRCFEDENITHVDGSVDPRRDVEVINLELILADLESVTKRITRCEKLLKTNDKENKIHFDLLNKIKYELESGKLINLQEYEVSEQKIIKQFQLLSSKPTFYIANIDDSEQAAKNLKELESIANELGSSVIPASIKIEQEISLLKDDEKLEYLELLNMDEPVLNKIIFEGYKLLGLKTYFTAGPKEIRAWTIRDGFTAPNAAGVIHTDFERGFIKAEVIDFKDFIACNGESGAKEKGRLRLEGKEYLVKDGDVIHFKFNV